MAGLTFYSILVLAVVAGVAARTHHDRPRGRDQQDAVQVPVGTRFQLSVLENGKEKYLYSEGEKVLTTSNPDSVGTERTIWESVDGITPYSTAYIDAFAIKNSDTGYTLLYDGEFYGKYIEGLPLAGWKLFESNKEDAHPRQYRLVYLPHSNGFIPGTFGFKPVEREHERRSSASAVAAAARYRSGGDHESEFDPRAPGIPVPVGTKFRLSIVREDGKEEYLYSEGEKVKRTSEPESVGTKRTIWESVNGLLPLSSDYINGFAIRNADTGYTLLYDGEFYGKYIEDPEELPLAGWKLFLAARRDYPTLYHLVYLPYYQNNGKLNRDLFRYQPLLKGIRWVQVVA